MDAVTAIVAQGRGVAVGQVEQLVVAEAEQRVPPVSAAPPLGRLDPQRPLRGRGKLVEALVGLVDRQSSGPRVQVLQGLGGCGKTSIALEVAARIAARGRPVWWVSAADTMSLVAGMLAVARQLGASDDELRYLDAADVVWQRLAAADGGWLLVIDNADDPIVLDTASGGRLADGTGWLRPMPVSGLVLVTSRDAGWPRWSTRHPVTVLKIETAAQVLYDYTGGQAGTADDAARLAARLGGLPLALQIAGSYLSSAITALLPDPTTAVTFTEYAAELDRVGIELFTPADSGRSAESEHSRQVIGTTWELSLDLLAARGLPAARTLLRLLTMLADAPVPYRLLLAPDVVAASTLLAGQDAASLSRLLRGLADVGLVNMSHPESGGALATLRIHPLVRDASRRGQEMISMRGDLLTLAVRLLHRAASSDAGLWEDPRVWPTWQALAPHAFHLVRVVAEIPGLSPDVAEQASYVAILAARTLYARGLYNEAEAEHRATYDVERQALGDRHSNTLTTRHEIARVLYARGRYREAENEYQAVYEIRRRVLGDDHRDTLATRHNRAMVMLFLGRYREAENEYRVVYEIRRRMFGDEHPDTLETRHSIAVALHSRGLYEKAEVEYRAVHDAMLRVLGNDHPDTLSALNQIAGVLRLRGLYDEAEAEFQALHATARRVLGDNHRHVLNVRANIARVHHDQGRYDEAEAEFRAVHDDEQRVLGDEHPNTLAARHGLATVLHARGRHDEAEAEFRAVYDARRRVLGDEHPDTLATQRTLEHLQRELNRSSSQD
jgi:tetratricopeptide (TPR) repeat protein